VTQIILGAVNFVATIGGLYVMQKFGRRWPLIIGGLWMSIWLFVFASVGVSRDVENDKTAGTRAYDMFAGNTHTHVVLSVMIASACLFIVGFATTWAPGVWIIISESFAPQTRAKQCSLATASMWIWNFMISFFTPFITDDIGYAYGFVFAGCT
jgi:SP family sugar:H+ symporter-like MFS transporter